MNRAISEPAARRRTQRVMRLSSMRATAVALAGGCALLLSERRHALRPSKEPRWLHDVRNAAFAAIGALSVRLLEEPIALRVAAAAEEQRNGLTQQLPASPQVRDACAVVLLDYTLYLWHVLCHQLPLLWRFHAMHHSDLDLTASTGFRFHPGELALTVGYRAAQVRLLGVSPRAYRVWQNLTACMIAFHHANLNIGRHDIWLRYLFVTPKMHERHHSSDAGEANCNWSSGLSLWDRLHHTLSSDESRARDIGLTDDVAEKRPTLIASLMLPTHL